ncbi:MAG: alpha-ketoglutarate-dependent dioxygenase AlkB [Deltaproteobacteria bacterium]
MQCALFGAGPPRFDPALPGVRRVELAGGAWIEHHPDWLEGHTGLFEQLASHIPWQSQRRQMYDREVDVPRLVARAPESGSLAHLLRRLSGTLSERYQWALGSITLAHYRDGRDSVAFHGDKLGRWVDSSIVATVSVGAPRRFLLKPRAEAAGAPQASSRPLAFDLGWGDLFVMGGTCQRTWQHAVPKRSHADPRISIMFRPVVPSD